VLFALLLKPNNTPQTPATTHTSVQTTVTTAPETTTETTAPTEPAASKIATATIAATGDILLHERVMNSGFDPATGTYNYDSIFAYLAPYVQQADYAVANMEGTLCGTDNGYKYAGYPRFNSPDAIVDAAKAAGFDGLLTANNHAYDTLGAGLKRTQQVIADRGLAVLGTVPTAETPNYLVKDINGIRVGMVCYTYETVKQKGHDKALNAIPLDNADAPLINSFDYDHLDTFYTRLESQIDEMNQAGAEAIVMFIHWGNEYKTTPNSWQKKIGQALCELGVDVIVGGHAHVVQPMEVFTSKKNPKHTTLCLYSLGNAVSNIRYSETRPAETEDGMLFSFTLAKYTDGSVIVESANILSTWVNRHNDATGKEIFPVIPLDLCVQDWKSAFGLTDKTLSQAEASLLRSQKILSEGLAAANTFYFQQQSQLEQLLKTKENS
jgi:poly-gamma-glutamate synthesis protein (capsule biosynthesis protein)